MLKHDKIINVDMLNYNEYLSNVGKYLFENPLKIIYRVVGLLLFAVAVSYLPMMWVFPLCFGVAKCFLIEPSMKRIGDDEDLARPYLMSLRVLTFLIYAVLGVITGLIYAAICLIFRGDDFSTISSLFLHIPSISETVNLICILVTGFLVSSFDELVKVNNVIIRCIQLAKQYEAAEENDNHNAKFSLNDIAVSKYNINNSTKFKLLISNLFVMGVAVLIFPVIGVILTVAVTQVLELMIPNSRTLSELIAKHDQDNDTDDKEKETV